MNFLMRSTLTAALLFGSGTAIATAQTVTPAQRGEIEKIIRDYLIRNPEVLQEAIAELEKRQALADAKRHQAAVKENAQVLFNSPRHVVVGNPKGDVTLVEFFDYNCGFCKRALDDKLTLMKEDSQLRVVLKEFPVLGPGSIDAARVGVAVRMQDPTGKRYFEFHRRLLTGRGQVDRARAIAVAREVGLDVKRIERDIDSAEVRQSLEESFKLAERLGLNGTPSYVVGNEIVIGAVGTDVLRERINTARCGKATC